MTNFQRRHAVVGEMIAVKGPAVSRNELRNQIAKCRRLARLSDDETARRLLELADEYEAQITRLATAAA